LTPTPVRSCGRRLAALLGILMALFSPAASAQAPAAPMPPASNPPMPELRVEYLGAEKGYAVGTKDFTLLCVVRNVGMAPLPDKTLRLRCYTLVGLDYTSGELTPLVPALAPNQALAFRWRLTPSALPSSTVARARYAL